MWMLIVIMVAALIPGTARADCPPDCVGGGNAKNDCVIQWGGITSEAVSCVDGAACDMDGTVDGACTFGAQACFAVDPSCAATTLSAVKGAPAKLPAAGALAAAIYGLQPGQCTAAGIVVPVKQKKGPKPAKPGKAKLKIIATSDMGKDKDKLKLTCLPSAPSFAGDVQPILTATCATLGGCHDAVRGGNLSLLPGQAYGQLVGVRAENGKPRVTPGKPQKSELTRRLFGKGGAAMPLGCPGGSPLGGCLTETDIYTLITWIQAGAPNN
jgi:hypothetical protein